MRSLLVLASIVSWPPDLTTVLLAVAVLLVLALAWPMLLRRNRERPIRQLLGRVATETGAITCFVRGMFVPANEFFSRAPEYPPRPGGGVTVHKWANIPEVHSASDVRALAQLLQLLAATNHRLTFSCQSGDWTRQSWNDDAFAIGPHYASQLTLDTCEPRLVTFRYPAAFRSLVSQDVFETRAGWDYGLIYKGEHPATHRACWVVMGLGDLGTEAAAWFLRVNARMLGLFTGSRPFAAIVAVDSKRGRDAAILRWLQPKPSWWRRFLYRRRWQQLRGEAEGRVVTT
jgi:hypothetical protein